MKVGTQGAPHFPGCPRPKPLIPGTPKDGGRGGPTPPGRIGQSQRLLSGHAWPGAWGSRALRLKPGLATDQPGLRTSKTTSEKSVAGRRQRVGERRGPRGGRVLKTLAPDTGSPISRQRGDAPRGGRTPPHPRSEAELINVGGVNVPWAKEFLLQARRSIDCFQDSMPLSIRH